MAKCKGLLCKLLGHKWAKKDKAVPADHFGPGIFFMHGQGPYMIKTETVCSRCEVKHV